MGQGKWRVRGRRIDSDDEVMHCRQEPTRHRRGTRPAAASYLREITCNLFLKRLI